MNHFIKALLALALAWAGCLTAASQSVKDIMDDKNGSYIYAQARNADVDDAYASAMDELESRVAAFIASNAMKDYNAEWKDWVKRILNEKYGQTRVFLYVAVWDLSPNAANKPIPVGDTDHKAAPEPTPSATPAPTPAPKTSTTPLRMDEPDTAPATTSTPPTPPTPPTTPTTPSTPTTPTTPTQTTEEDATPSYEDIPSPGDDDTAPSREDQSGIVAVIDPDSPLVGIVERILNCGPRGDIAGELARGKNMRAISMYGNAASKYVAKAFVVVPEGNEVKVFTPENEYGERTDVADGSVRKVAKNEIEYWFLKR